jgi:hypothetical protein
MLYKISPRSSFEMTIFYRNLLVQSLGSSRVTIISQASGLRFNYKLLFEAAGGRVITVTRLEPSDGGAYRCWENQKSGRLCDSPLERGVGVCSSASLTHPDSRTIPHAPSQEGSFIPCCRKRLACGHHD